MAKELSTKTNLAMDFIEAHTFKYPNMDDVVITEQDAWEAIELAKKDVIDRIKDYIDTHEYLVHYKDIDYIFNEIKKAIEKNKL